MVSISVLHNVVAEYLYGAIDRKAFAQRFFETMYGIEKTGDETATHLGYAIEFSLAEAIVGLISESELRVELAKHVKQFS